jgi:hypothetical protein
MLPDIDAASVIYPTLGVPHCEPALAPWVRNRLATAIAPKVCRTGRTPRKLRIARHLASKRPTK